MVAVCQAGTRGKSCPQVTLLLLPYVLIFSLIVFDCNATQSGVVYVA